MTKEEFAALQLRHQESGKTLKGYLKETGVVYCKQYAFIKNHNTLTYLKKKRPNLTFLGVKLGVNFANCR